MRKPAVRDGELHVYYGKIDRWSSPDVVYHSGDGVPRADQRLLHWWFGCERQRILFGEEQEKAGFPVAFDPSFIAELEARGYDLTTLRFSIKKKPTPSAP